MWRILLLLKKIQTDESTYKKILNYVKSTRYFKSDLLKTTHNKKVSIAILADSSWFPVQHVCTLQCVKTLIPKTILLKMCLLIDTFEYLIENNSFISTQIKKTLFSNSQWNSHTF